MNDTVEHTETQQNTLALGNTKPELRARGWFLTLWNFTDEEVLDRKTQLPAKTIIGSETCPKTGRPHHHMYIYGKNAIKFSTLQALFERSITFKSLKDDPSMAMTTAKKKN